MDDYKEPQMGHPYLGSTLTLSGQVYRSTNNITGKIEDQYAKWNGNATVYASDIYDDDGYITGKITNGQLSYSVGQPDLMSWNNTVQQIFDESQEFMLKYLYDDVTYSDPDVSAFILWYLDTEEYHSLGKGGYVYANQGMFAEYVFHI